MILDQHAVARLLRMEDLIPAVATALADFSAGRAVMPGRVVVPVADHGGFFGVMPAYAGALGAKLVTWFPNNQGVPTHHAVIQLFKPETGEPLVTMDGTIITEMRTGAASAVATNLLARRDASTLAIIGSGVQARSHLHALRLVRQFSDVRVWSPRHAGAHNNLGQILERQQKIDAAAAAYRQAVDAQPTFRLARFNLGRMLIALSRPDDAIVELEKLTEPRDAEAPRYLFALATAHVRAGHREEGIKWATDAKQLAASHGQAELAAAIERELARLR